jgi:hypothetical protein
MSERIYKWLLRLYPSNFQKAYGEEALQLFRDRSRDERGFLSSLRLWLDLLGDLVISIPREYRSVPAASAVSRADGTPSFHLLEDETLSLRSLMYGGVAALIVYGTLLPLIGHGGKPVHLYAPDAQRIPRHSAAIPKPPPPPTVTLTYSPTSLTSGSTLILTATVLAAATAPTPTGHVRFFDGNTVLTMGKLKNGTVTVEGKLSHRRKHSLNAVYYGDFEYSPASSIGERGLEALK